MRRQAPTDEELWQHGPCVGAYTAVVSAGIGVDGTDNPHEERVVELPAGYDHVWTNRSGEYVLANDPNFNPNVGSNLDWQRIERRTP